MIYQKYFKRMTDIILSGTTLIILSPIFIIVSLAIKIDSRGPVFFTQNRAGMHGRIFKMYKFRTMLTFENSYYRDGTQIPNYERITAIGKILRKTSLDELPQLINIFIGDMSVVGPRPTLLYQVEKYDEKQARRLNGKPGLTGLAQISGRNELSWEDKIKYDIEYIDRISFFRDLEIIIKTVFVVFKTEQVAFTKPDDISKHDDNDILKDVGDIKRDSQNQQ